MCITTKPAVKRPNIVINSKNANDVINYKNPRHVAGNSTYASMAKSGKFFLLLSDSICSRMREFNRNLCSGHAYRKQFPGSTSHEIAHYIIPTLINDKPDMIVIHAGTNDLRNTRKEEIVDSIMNIVGTYQKYGVTNIYVSSLIFREQYHIKVSEVNQLLRHRQTLNNFILIENDDITREHIWKDNLHLNNYDTINIANNFINMLDKRVSP